MLPLPLSTQSTQKALLKSTAPQQQRRGRDFNSYSSDAEKEPSLKPTSSKAFQLRVINSTIHKCNHSFHVNIHVRAAGLSA